MHRFFLPSLAVLTTVFFLLNACSGTGPQAHIRLLNASSGYDSLDLYVNADSSADTRELSAVKYETVSSYAGLDKNTYAVKFNVSGVSSTLATLAAEALSDDTHTTYVAYGPSGSFATLKIAEDVDAADSGQTNLTVLNTAGTGALDVYLTDDSVSLNDAAPIFSNITSGTAAPRQTISSGTYRLRVTGTGDNTDLRFDASNVTFSSTQVVSLILTATEGGVLVNALVLPQQSSLTAYENTKARVRGAVGIANGSAVTATAGGAGLFTSATLGVIGSRYVQVDAGSMATSVTVDGNAVSVPDDVLVPGGDYTLLIWNDATGTQTTWISDDNRLPASTTSVKIRLLNGMSGLGAPATLAVDYSPTAEDVALGEASAATELDSSSNYEVDVTDANTGQNLLSLAGVSLQGPGVYTMFVAGGGGVAVSATLRKDR